MIAKQCLACDSYRENCDGAEKKCSDWTPINYDREVTPVNEEFVVSDPDAGAERPVMTPEKPKQVIAPEHCAGTDGAEESLMDKFARIGAKRQAQALEALRKLGHLTSKYERKRTGVTAYTYEWTPQMALEIIQPIEEALAELKGELLGCDSPREHGLMPLEIEK